MPYKKITDDVFIPSTATPEAVILSELETELAELKANNEIIPTDSELLEWARSNHPYYFNKDLQETLIQEKEELIIYLKSL